MIKTEILVIGGGASGLAAAIAAAKTGAEITVIERDYSCGGRLLRQTEKIGDLPYPFIGLRGYQIAQHMLNEAKSFSNIKIFTNTLAQSIYQKNVVCKNNNSALVINAQHIIFATGSQEGWALFPGNDLPGIYSAAAAQSLLNIYGIKPAGKVAIIGSDNMALQLAFQFYQCGIEVAAVIEKSSQIIGESIYAAKIARLGIPILTSHNVLCANGTKNVDSLTIKNINEDKITTIACDGVCLSTQSSPSTHLLEQAGCQMRSGNTNMEYIPCCNEQTGETNISGIYATGSCCNTGSISEDIIKGAITGINVAFLSGHSSDHYSKYLDKLYAVQRFLNGESHEFVDSLMEGANIR